MPKRRQSRIYVSRGRFYGDFRDFSAVGGAREALIPPGEKRATTDPDIAAALVAARLTELEGKRRGKVLLGISGSSTLKAYIERHVAAKEAGPFARRHVQNLAHQLEVARLYFGDHLRLEAISPRDVQEYVGWLRKRPTYRGKSPSEATVRQYLVSLSGMFSRAVAEGEIAVNPVAGIVDKPTAQRREAKFLEVRDAAKYLEACREWERGAAQRAIAEVGEGARCQRHSAPKMAGDRDSRCALDRAESTGLGRSRVGNPAVRPLPLYTIIATFLLTGGRYSEVMGLDVGDVNLKRKTVTFRPNEWRNLKTQTSHRTVPLWPQLATILKAYERPKEGLLFPDVRGVDCARETRGQEKSWQGEHATAAHYSAAERCPRDPRAGVRPRMISDLRQPMDEAASLIGWPPGSVRSRMLRHTYCSARIQTLDHGAPVSLFVVSKEMGHGGLALVERVYAHLGQHRHRSESVEYRAGDEPFKPKEVE